MTMTLMTTKMIVKVMAKMVVLMIGGLMHHHHHQAVGFNINTDLARVINGSANTSFGFSVALWSDIDGTKRLAIGAPRTYMEKLSVPIGSLHLCESQEERCEEQFPPVEDIERFRREDNETNLVHPRGFGFGETVYSTNGEDSKLMVCAPRFPPSQESFPSVQLQTRGACFLITDASPTDTIWPYSDPRYDKRGVKVYNNDIYTGFGLLGFSSIKIPEKEILILGGPGAFYQQGMLLSWKTKKKRIGSVSRVISDTDSSLDNSYEGWATVTGKFDGEKYFVATSILKASGRDNEPERGEVKFCNERIGNPQRGRIKGSTVGNLFGYSLGVGDLDGDGVDDLAVGEPLARTSDEGRVIVYYAPLINQVTRANIELLGPVANGRFGTSVNSPGDLNQDGFDDLLVGAPYGEEGGRVYVYNGGVNGLSEVPRQIIRASEFGTNLRGFGFSLDGGLDMDNNGYPDVIIGAHESDAVVFLRSAPVVILKGNVEFEPTALNLGNKSCTISPPNATAEDVVCFYFMVSLQFASKSKENLTVILDIDLDPRYQRVNFYDSHSNKYTGNHTIGHEDNPLIPLNLKAYVKPGRPKRDVSVTADIIVKLPEVVPPDSATERLSAVVPSVLDQSAISLNNPPAQMRLDCEDLSTCFSTPDLKLSAKAPSEITIDEKEFELEVAIISEKDKAYSVRLDIQHQTALTFRRASSQGIIIPNCDTVINAAEEVGMRRCFFSSNFQKNQKVEFKLIFTQSSFAILNLEDRRLDVLLQVGSDSQDLNEDDNAQNITLSFVSKVNLFADGALSTDSVEGRTNETLSLERLSAAASGKVNNSEITVDKLGPMITHKFSITNQGPSPLQNAQIVLHIPILPTGMPFFYLAEPPRISSQLTCNLPTINPYNLTLKDFRCDHDSDCDQSNANMTLDDEASVTSLRRKREIAKEVEAEEEKDEKQERNNDDVKSSKLLPSEKTTNDYNIVEVKCNGKLNCEEIRCELSSLAVEEEVTIDLNAYVVVATLDKPFGRTELISLETFMTFESSQTNVTVNDHAINHNNPDDINVDEPNATEDNPAINVNDTFVAEESSNSTEPTIDVEVKIKARTLVTIRRPKKYGIGAVRELIWWQWILAFIIALMAIIILTGILHKCGFFRRKKKEELRVERRKSQKLMKEKQYEGSVVHF